MLGEMWWVADSALLPWVIALSTAVAAAATVGTILLKYRQDRRNRPKLRLEIGRGRVIVMKTTPDGRKTFYRVSFRVFNDGGLATVLNNPTHRIVGDGRMKLTGLSTNVPMRAGLIPAERRFDRNNRVNPLSDTGWQQDLVLEPPTDKPLEVETTVVSADGSTAREVWHLRESPPPGQESTVVALNLEPS